MTETADTTFVLDDGRTERGVTERRFTLDRPAKTVPGILWTPSAPGSDGAAAGPRPLVLFGHGGTQGKRAVNILALARRMVRHHGFAAASIDQPFHGDRRPDDERTMSVEERRERLGRRMFGRDRQAVIDQAVGDWTAVLDALQQLDEVGAGPIGYWGLSMGSHFGVPFVAGEPRITAAVLGLFGWSPTRGQEGLDDLARQVRVPVLFLVQWDDEIVARDSALALFDLLGSADKTLHAHPGRHVEVPPEENDAAEAHFARHLSPATTGTTGAADPAATAGTTGAADPAATAGTTGTTGTTGAADPAAGGQET
jgi:dienelactone hydrolase